MTPHDHKRLKLVTPIHLELENIENDRVGKQMEMLFSNDR